MDSQKKLVVIGGGAAGFFCAVNAAAIHSGLEVVLLEKTNKLLSKVKVSGGGRCNVTHACFSVNELIQYYPRGASFLKKGLHHFNPSHTIHWFSERGVVLKTETDGRIFPVTDSSQTIIDCLLEEARKHHVHIQMQTELLQVTQNDKAANSFPRFSLHTSRNQIIHCDFLCLATGGFRNSESLKWLTESGHKIVDPVPSLFTFNMPQDDITSLMGISVPEVTVKIQDSKVSQKGSLLITHWGLSGPAILKTSAFGARELAEKNYNFNFRINWLPDYNENTLKEKMQTFRFSLSSQKMVNRNPFMLPSRLWEYFLSKAEIHFDLRWADLPSKAQNKLIKILCGQEFRASGKTTFKEEFVTAGGIDTEGVNNATLESKLIPGLYFAGEVLDVDGVTGGFNFQNAWTTGWLVAENLGSN